MPGLWLVGCLQVSVHAYTEMLKQDKWPQSSKHVRSADFWLLPLLWGTGQSKDAAVGRGTSSRRFWLLAWRSSSDAALT